MEKITCCKKCTLKSDHPGVVIDENGICNFCKFEVPDDMYRRYRYVHDTYNEYEHSTPRQDGGYDCLIMISGGKDSVYILNKLVEEKKKKVIAYTFNLPYESKAGLENIERVCNVLDIDHILFTSNIRYRKLMKHTFNNVVAPKPGKYIDEKLPCIVCSQFFMINGYLQAYYMNIPYVLYCSDPQQLYSFESDIKVVIKTFIEKVGQDICTEVFGNVLQEILAKDANEIPKIVLPYVPLKATYKPQEIIEELTQKGLYKGKRLVQHCSLFGLLNYYSYKHWNCFFYEHDIAAAFRDGTIKDEAIKRRTELAHAEIKDIILDIAEGRIEASAQKERLSQLLNDGISKEEADYFAELITKTREVGNELGIDFTK